MSETPKTPERKGCACTSVEKCAHHAIEAGETTVEEIVAGARPSSPAERPAQSFRSFEDLPAKSRAELEEFAAHLREHREAAQLDCRFCLLRFSRGTPEGAHE